MLKGLRKAQIKGDMPVGDGIRAQEEVVGEYEQKAFMQEHNENIEGFTIDMHLLLQAWAHFRPVRDADKDK